jgi:very-short-patch-repair endonuclease
MMASEPHDFADKLRQSSTKFEDMLWQRLRGSRLNGAKFKRQVPFGRYVVDFYCHAARLVVEIDGVQHDWYAEYDAERTKVVESFGARVIRFTNDQVRDDLDAVLRRIGDELRLPFR